MRRTGTGIGLPLMAASLMHVANIRNADRAESPQTYNLSAEEIAERDRPISRQERRQMDRLSKKGRSI